MQTSRFESRLVQTGRYAALAALFCVPISVAAVNVFAAVVALTVLINPLFWRECGTLWRIPVVRASLMLIVALAVSTLYSSAGFTEAMAFAAKEQKKLLLIPLLIWLFRDIRSTLPAQRVLLGVLTVTLLMSYANYGFNVNLFGSKNYNEQLDPGIVFHNRITQGMLFAFFFGMAAWKAIVYKKRVLKAGFLVVALMAAINVMLINNGRSGQVAIVLVAGYLLYELYKLRGISARYKILISAISVVLLSGLFVLATQQENSRINMVQQEIAMGPEGSTGMRIAFYKLALELIREKPILGFGVGSLPFESQRLVDEKKTRITWSIGNPHNEYLLMGLQMGLIGLGLFAWLLYAAYAASLRLPSGERVLLGSYGVIFVCMSALNSLLLDFVEGHLFVLMIGIFLAPLYASKAKDSPSLETLAS